SPDLTRNDRATLAASGSNTGENYVANDYCTISAFAESPCAPGVLWAGSDDGLVHVSRDNGASWNNVTPPELPAWATTHVEPSPHTAGGCYLSATLHQLDDFTPRMFKTDDYGATWQAITHGIPSDQFVRVVRADPERAGLLYAGTEAGVWVSLDDGAYWQPLREDLPAVAIYDLAVKDNDLIAATHGRSMWILDDVTPLRQYHTIDPTAPAHLFLPPPVLRLTRQVYGLDSLVALYSPYAAPNPPAGVVVSYWLQQAPTDAILLELIDRDGTVVSSATSVVAAHVAAPIGPLDYELRGGTATLTGNVVNTEEPGIRWGPITLGAAQHVVPTTRRGLNRCTLPIVYPGARRVPGALGGGITQPLALPGSYTVRLTIGELKWTAPVEIVRDPQTNASQADLEAQFGLMVKIRDKVSVIHDAVNQIRHLRRQIVERTATTEARNVAAPITAAATTLLDSLATIEAMLIQPQLHERSGELAGTELAPGLNNKLEKLGYAVARSDHAPTRQSLELFADLSDRTDRQLARLRDVLANDLAAFNQLFADGGIAAIVL
ncbi:MAG: glycosyl hydrolase, partial [Chloroflexi bacterium]|nr:glycosyl hydrolase [Chloroflexota bacterium]